MSAKRFSGKVVKGDGIGKRLGYPTANLDLTTHSVDLVDGVYAAKANFRGEDFLAALVLTAATNKVEIYLIDYLGEDFYGEKIEVEVGVKVSGIEPFFSEEELIRKIEADVDIIRSL